MIDGQNFFDQPIRNNLIIYDNIRKISTGQGDDYTTGCLLDHNCFKIYYNMIAYDFTGNLEQQTTTFYIIEEAKKTVLDFLQGNVKIF